MKSVYEFADILIERCTWLLDLSDITFSHVREIETMTDHVQLLITAVAGISLLVQLNTCREIIENMYNLPIQLKDQEDSIKSTVIIAIIKLINHLLILFVYVGPGY